MHLAPEYSLDIQAHIPAALATIHNFTHHHEPDEEEDGEGDGDGDEPISGRAENDDDEAEWADVGVNKLDMRWDGIVTVMWEQYVNKHIAQAPWDVNTNFNSCSFCLSKTNILRPQQHEMTTIYW